MNFLRQSTAVDVALGPFIDDDGITPATGLTITQAETRLKKNNGAWAQANDATSATHEEEGWYEKELDATDTNTVGILIVAVYISGSLASWKEYQVVEEAVYDALFAASAVGPLLANSDGSGLTAINLPNQTMDIVGSITGNLSGSVGSVTGAVGSVTAMTTANVIQISGDSGAADTLETWLDDTVGAIPWLGIIDQGTAQSATGTTLVLRAATPFGSDDAILGATLWAFGSDQGYWQARLVTDYTTADDTATVAAWDVTPTGTITYKLFGTAPQSASGSGATAQEVWEYADRQLTALDEDVTTIDLNATTIGTATNVTTVNGLAANVITATSINADAFTAAKFAADVTTELQSGLATSAAVATLQTSVDDLPTNAELATSQAAADDAVLAAIAALNNLSAAQVATEIGDALGTDTYAEPGQGTPAATATLATKIGFLYKAWRNRTTQTASEYALYGDDAVTKDQEAAVSDNGTTLDRGEVATGA